MIVLNEYATQVAEPRIEYQLSMFEDEPDLHEKNGVVYTRPWVVEMILDLCGYTASANLVDSLAVEPSAGSGAFVVAMAERLMNSCRAQQRPILDCLNSIRAFEIDDAGACEARRRCSISLRRLGVSDYDAGKLSNAWIEASDYLAILPDLPPCQFVLGNPPYIRLEDIGKNNDSYRDGFTTMKGRSDLYIAFFEAALRQLAPDGVLGFICADRWMLNQYGSELRKHITSSFSVEAIVEMHHAEAFETEVSAYPAVTVIRRTEQGRVVVARIDAPKARTIGKAIAQDLILLRTGEIRHSTVQGVRAGVFSSWFRGAEPWPATSPDRLVLLRRLEAEFPPIESLGTRVGIGVATGADQVYITRDHTVAEAEQMIPLAMAADLKTGKLVWSGHYLVSPWSRSGLVSLTGYPAMASYFEKHRARLQARNVGKKNAVFWYRTIDRVDLDLLRCDKLYIADIKATLRPVLDRGETYPHHNLYFIQSDIWDLEVLGGLLLSDVAQFYVECYGVRMRGGYLRFQAQYLRRIRVPDFSTISEEDRGLLKEAFHTRNGDAATKVAHRLYRIKETELAGLRGN